MSQLVSFTKKEFLEFYRTKKMLVLWIVFAILGIMSPLMAKLTPAILKMTFENELLIPLIEPTSIDSWMQFYKNMTQIGIYLVVILFSGIVNREISQGTLIPLVTKGLKRRVIILSKYILMVTHWTFALVLAFVITWGYTLYYFPDDVTPKPLLGLAMLWFFGLFLLAITLLMSTLLNSNYGSLVGSIIVIVLLYLINLFDQITNWNPISLTSINLELSQGLADWKDYLPAIVLCILGSLLLVGISGMIFRQKRLLHK